MAGALVSCPLKIVPGRIEERRGRRFKCRCEVPAAASSSVKSDNYHHTLEALKSADVRPKRWLGQNYLVNGFINDEIAMAAKIRPGDLVLEIGPGIGALTHSLVNAGAHVIGVEKDPDMVKLAARRFKGHPKVKLFQADILKWNIRSEVTEWMAPIRKDSRLVKVVSNLPFNITSDVVKKFLPMSDLFSTMVLLIQDDVAARFIDLAPCNDDYRPISLFIRFYSEMNYHFKVPRSNFFPQPPVDGAVVTFRLKKESQYPLVRSREGFFKMVSTAFREKRKMLRNSLRHSYNPLGVVEALRTIGLLDTVRPHQLTFGEFVALYNLLEEQLESQLEQSQSVNSVNVS